MIQLFIVSRIIHANSYNLHLQKKERLSQVAPSKIKVQHQKIIPHSEMPRKPSTASLEHPQVLTRNLRTSW